TMKLRMLFVFSLLLVSLLIISPAAAVLAQEEEEAPPETVTLTATHTKLEGVYGTSFEFEVDLEYTGATEARTFDLVVSGPTDWDMYITPTYPTDKHILNIELEPPPPFQAGLVTKILIHVSPPLWRLTEPGEYSITVGLASGEVSGSIDLTVVVTSTYAMSLVPSEERLNTTATAGRDNYFSIEVQNLGSGAIDDITFSSNKPSGWTVEFSPDEIDTLAAIDSQTVEVNIKPPAKTIAGDYQISLTAKGKQFED
ncbi:unnamed protein product, partial [marine sediment metagenome]